jgi:hypothetical protein
MLPHRAVRLAAVSLALMGLLAAPAAADDYDPSRAGHPLRVIAYLLHPVGVALDYLVMRPAHWLGSQEPTRTIVGHEESLREEAAHEAEHAAAQAARAESESTAPRQERRDVPPSRGFNRPR